MKPLRAPTMPDTSTDPELMVRLTRGDLGALGALYERYHADVRSVAVHAGVPRYEADDVTQEVFLMLVDLAARYDGRESARPWVLGIAWRMAVKQRRSAARWFRVLGELITHVHRPTTDPEETALARERWVEFRAKVAKLPERMQAVFVLVEIEGLTGEEAATALGIPVATVWTRLHYARKKMHLLLGGQP